MIRARKYLVASSACVLGLAALAACGGTGNGSQFDDAGNGNGGGPGAQAGETGGSFGGESPVLGGDTSNGAQGDASPGDVLGQSCATAEADTQRTPVYMDIVLDASRSMDGYAGESGFIVGAREKDPLAPTRTTGVCVDAGGVDCRTRPLPGTGMTGKKWIAVRGALNAFIDALAQKPADGSLGVRLVRFSGTPTTGAETALRPVDAAHGATIKRVYNPQVWPDSGTPLDEYTFQEIEYLQGFKPEAPLRANGKRVLVLMTDGVPDNGTPSRAQKKQNILNAVAAAAKSTTAPVTTFAVGIGDPSASADAYDETFMSAVGQAGGAAEPGCDAAWANGKTTKPCHLQITPGTKSAAELQAEFSAAIERIAGSVFGCEFEIQRKDGSEFDPARINVVRIPVSGAQTLIPKSATDGWSYDNEANPTKVILNGPTCSALKAPDAAGTKIKVVIGCPTRVN